MEKIDVVSAPEEDKPDLVDRALEGCPAVKSQICSFWKKGKCKRGEGCTFAHGKSNMNEPVVLQAVPCPFHRGGFCRLGDKCRNLHVEAASVLQQSPASLHRRANLCHFQKRGYCRFGDRCLQAHSEEELIGGDEASRARAEEKFAAKQSKMGVGRGFSEQDNPRMITKKLMCSYWEKGRCTRGSNCSFAHGPEELNQKAADQFYKTAICRFWKAGRCQLGSECRQAHGKEELPSASPDGADFEKSAEYKEFMNPSEL